MQEQHLRSTLCWGTKASTGLQLQGEDGLCWASHPQKGVVWCIGLGELAAGSCSTQHITATWAKDKDGTSMAQLGWQDGILPHRCSKTAVVCSSIQLFAYYAHAMLSTMAYQLQCNHLDCLCPAGLTSSLTPSPAPAGL
jgi:hypothetical protein